MRKIWILQGSTGEYSDRTDWIVRAYAKQEQAIRDEHQANNEADTCFKQIKEEDVLWDDEHETRIKLKHLTIDPSATFDYTGTTYWVRECMLVEDI